MNNYKDLEGKIKTIRTNVRNGSKTILREESGIIISCKPSEHYNSCYRIEGVSLLGKSFIMNIGDNSEILDLEIHEKKAKYLLEIRSSIIRKRKALEIIDIEKNNIENLKVSLLSDTGNMTQNDFISNLNKALYNLDFQLKIYTEHSFENASIHIQLNECNIYLSVKKYHIENIRIEPIRYSSKENLKLEEKELKDGKNYKKFSSYYIEDFFSKQYYDLISKNNLTIQDYSKIKTDSNNTVNFLLSHHITKESDKLFIDESTLDFIVKLVKIIENCKIPY